MKKYLITLIVLLFFCGAALAEEPYITALDGSGWSKLSADSKAFWADGFISAASVVAGNYVISSFNKYYLEKGEFGRFLDAAKKNREENRERFCFKMNTERIVKGIDHFYTDPKNQDIKIVDAAYVVKMEAERKKPELIEAQKRYLRMQPINIVEESIRQAKQKEDFANVKQVKERSLRIGIFAEPKINNPTSRKDYDYTSLFRYGGY
jgi:hypothetical protein